MWFVGISLYSQKIEENFYIFIKPHIDGLVKYYASPHFVKNVFPVDFHMKFDRGIPFFRDSLSWKL